MNARGESDASIPGMDAFAALGEPVRAALSDRGFETPTEPQRRAIPPLAAGKNALVIAPTGTGKTETAMLPVFDALLERGSGGESGSGSSSDSAPGSEGIGALYVTPLRALNRDMLDRLDWWGDRLGTEIAVRHGDTTDYERSQQAEDPPDVLITTPESLQAILTGERMREGLADVEHVVIDEIHELAASKRGAQLAVGLERLRAVAGPFRRIGLSATVGEPAAVGRFLVGAGDPAPDRPGDREFEVVAVDVGSRVEFEVVRPEVTPADERLAGRLATGEEVASHVRAIRDVVRANESTLVFVNTRQTAEALGSRLKKLGDAPGPTGGDADPIAVEIHHGSLASEVRVDVEERFKRGDLDALVCTSSMELGIDVGRVDHVVQYGSPREVARLLQRVGRAGHRRDRVSRGTVVTSGADDTLEALAIARRARNGAVEPAAIHHGSLDVVANQIAGVLMDHDEASVRAVYDLVTSAYPFRDLTESQFREVVDELAGNRLLWRDEDRDRLETSGGTWQYFYANLSMIPDEETYVVYDVSARRGVGTLDERFVVNAVEPGATFIQRGELWRVERVDEEEERVEVSPLDDPGGDVPSWIGQEIPVPEPVAAEVGELRGIVGAQLAAGGDRAGVARDVADRYPTGPETVAAALAPVERQVEAGAPLPADDRIVVEGRGRTIAVNVARGHEVNETLGRLLSALIGQRTGSSVGMEIDPYRIELEVPSGVDPGTVIEILETTDPDHLEAYLELAVKRSDALKFTLTHVAAKFGALKRYQGRDRFGADRLLAALEDSPAYDEAVREVFHTDLAVEDAADLLREVRAGAVDVVAARERTPIGTDGRSSGREFLVPENADASVIEAIRERLANDRVILLCLHCADWSRETQVRRVPDEPTCPDCGATRIAALNPWDEETVAAVRAAEKDGEQERLTRRAHRAANLVQSHGKRAVIALAARGVGPQTAARIIANLREDEDEFYRDILEQERQYARTQAFWD